MRCMKIYILWELENLASETVTLNADDYKYFEELKQKYTLFLSLAYNQLSFSPAARGFAFEEITSLHLKHFALNKNSGSNNLKNLLPDINEITDQLLLFAEEVVFNLEEREGE